MASTSSKDFSNHIFNKFLTFAAFLKYASIALAESVKVHIIIAFFVSCQKPFVLEFK